MSNGDSQGENHTLRHSPSRVSSSSRPHPGMLEGPLSILLIKKFIERLKIETFFHLTMTKLVKLLRDM